MKRVLAAALIVSPVMAGCTSTRDVLMKPPTQVYHSDRSVNEVAFCLANKNRTSALERDDGSKVVLIKNGWGGLSLAFTIWPEGEGSRIEYRREFGTIGGIWKQCVGADGGASQNSPSSESTARDVQPQ